MFYALHTNKGAWCSRHINRYLAARGWPPATLHAFYPHGMADLTRALHQQLAAKTLTNTKLVGVSLSSKIGQLLHARLVLLPPQAENLRLCYRTGALSPWRLDNAKAAYHVANMFWQAVGCTVTNGNAYTKRTLLAKIIWQADLVWLGDASPHFANTHQFIDNALAKTKNQGQKWGKLVQPILTRIKI